MVLDNVYQFLLEKFGRLVIIRSDSNRLTLIESKEKGTQRLQRLFFTNVVDGKIMEGGDDDANKILTEGIVANRNGASASNCVEEIFRIMLLNDMQLEIRYLEELITNSIIMGIICEERQKTAILAKELFECEKKEILKNHKDSFDYRYSVYKKSFVTYVNKLNEEDKEDNWKVRDNLAFGEIINSAIVECLIRLEYKEKTPEDRKNGVTAKKIQKLEKMKMDLEKLKDFQNSGKNGDALDDYYVKMWQEYHKDPITRDGDGSTEVSLVNVLELPDIRDDVNGNGNGNVVINPFDEQTRVQFVFANSGMGKSFMLRSIIVACLAEYIYNNHKELMGVDEIKAYEGEVFSNIRRFYFGDKKRNKIPVYIEAAKINDFFSGNNDDDNDSHNGEVLLNLCENYDELRAAFKEITDELLFLIDSLDEIEEKNVNKFNQCLYSMIGQVCYKNQFIITSRFSGRSIHINEMRYFRLGGFDIDAIHSYLDKCSFLNRSRELKDYIDNNKYAFELAKNPFMLTTMLDNQTDFSIHSFLASIINAIITRRMNLKVLTMNENEIRAILSYLAFYVSFCEGDADNSIEKGHISNIIKRARRNGLISVSGYSVDISDEQINTFVNSISCQSGIITITNVQGHIKFEFQDELVMCFLAAEYINNLSGMARDDIPEGFYFDIANANDSTIHNVYEIDKFFSNFHVADYLFSRKFCQVMNLLIQIAMKKSFGISLIYYMLLQGLFATEEKTISNIKRFFLEYREKMYGDNILFRQQAERNKVEVLIDRLLNICDKS